VIDTQNVGEPMINYTCKCGFRYEVVDFIDFDKKCPECEFHWEEEIFQVIQRVKNRENIKNKKLDADEIQFNIFGAKKDGADVNEGYEQIVSYFKSMYFPKVMRDDKNEEIWIYLDGIYVPDGKCYLKEIMRDCLGRLYSLKQYNMVICRIVADCFVDPNEFFNYNIPEEIPVNNGILNIFTRELTEFTPEKYFFNKIPVWYDKSKDCPKTKQFFSEIVKKDDVELLSEFIGFSLYKKYYLNKAFILSGDGRNGKSSYLNLIKHFIGDKNTASLTLEDMEDSSSFDIIELHNKMVDIAGDIGGNKLQNTSLFKSLTGTETVKANRKFLSPLNFKNYSKFVFSCNKLPKVNDDSEGWFRRWVMIDFPYKFVTEKEHNPNVPNEKIMIPNIEETLYHRDELSGLLNMALNSLENIIEKKEFSDNNTVHNIMKKWKMKSDPLIVFCDEHIAEDFDKHTSKHELIKQFNLYCKKNNLKRLQDRKITNGIKKLFNVTEIRLGTGNREYVFSGISLKNLQNDTNVQKKVDFTLIGLKQKTPNDLKHMDEMDKLDKNTKVTPKDNNTDIQKSKLVVNVEQYFDMAYDQIKKETSNNMVFIGDISRKIEFDDSLLQNLISEGKYFEPKAGFIQRL